MAALLALLLPAAPASASSAMTGDNLEFSVRDARGEVLEAGTLIKPRLAPEGSLTLRAERVAGPVDVEVSSEVDWALAARFLGMAQKQNIVLRHVELDEPSASAR